MLGKHVAEQHSQQRGAEDAGEYQRAMGYWHSKNLSPVVVYFSIRFDS